MYNYQTEIWYKNYRVNMYFNPHHGNIHTCNTVACYNTNTQIMRKGSRKYEA